MRRSRTQYKVALSQAAEPFIQSYIAKEGFVRVRLGQEDVYALGNDSTGYKYLQYETHGNSIDIYCWVGKYGLRFSPLIDHGTLLIDLAGPYNASIMSFITSLYPLSASVRNVKMPVWKPMIGKKAS